MIGIIGAMDVEIRTLLDKISNKKEVKTKVKTFYTGLLNDKEVVIVLAGIGKVNAAITTSLLIENFDISHVINIGVAGGQNGVAHKDIVISKEVLYHDVDLTVFDSGYVHGQMSGSEALFTADKTLLNLTINALSKINLPYRVGKIASGDQFVVKVSKLDPVNKLYDDIYAIEMEAAAIAHTCTLYNVPFIIYRSISDLIEDENQDHDFYEFLKDASLNATLVLEELVRHL
ncbi:MAG: 5'-methylthioadenosine/adenosylhomocysteine nucleosidase [Candidatus Izemoplasma sp.]